MIKDFVSTYYLVGTVPWLSARGDAVPPAVDGTLLTVLICGMAVLLGIKPLVDVETLGGRVLWVAVGRSGMLPPASGFLSNNGIILTACVGK